MNILQTLAETLIQALIQGLVQVLTQLLIVGLFIMAGMVICHIGIKLIPLSGTSQPKSILPKPR